MLTTHLFAIYLSIGEKIAPTNSLKIKKLNKKKNKNTERLISHQNLDKDMIYSKFSPHSLRVFCLTHLTFRK